MSYYQDLESNLLDITPLNIDIGFIETVVNWNVNDKNLKLVHNLIHGKKRIYLNNQIINESNISLVDFGYNCILRIDSNNYELDIGLNKSCGFTYSLKNNNLE